jgi:hypothetical protein
VTKDEWIQVLRRLGGVVGVIIGFCLLAEALWAVGL